MKNETLLAQFVLPSDQDSNSLYKQERIKEEPTYDAGRMKPVRELQQEQTELDAKPLVLPSPDTTSSDSSSNLIYLLLFLVLVLLLLGGFFAFKRRKKSFEIK